MRHDLICIKDLGDLEFGHDMQNHSAGETPTFLTAYRSFSKQCFASMCVISIGKVPSGRCLSLALLMKESALCLLASCKTEAEAFKLAQGGCKKDRHLMFAVCKHKVALLSLWSK